jgi:hypothetical protein
MTAFHQAGPVRLLTQYGRQETLGALEQVRPSENSCTEVEMQNKTTTNPHHKDDIFISYAHIDNTRFAKNDKGWVDALHEQLDLRLYQLLGVRPIIWRDLLMTGNEDIGDTLHLKIAGVKILVVILSPRYVKSEECLRELRQFCHPEVEAERSHIDAKERVFKLIKTPIDDGEDAQEPEELQGMLGYKFYEKHPITGKLREFQHLLKFKSFPKFIHSVYDVAVDIKEIIKCLKKTDSGKLIEPPLATTVYLAQTESGLDNKRMNIRRELKEHGYHVLPDKDLPRDVTRLEQEVRGYLKRSQLSLHLIGGNYDSIPEGERVRSYVRIQYEMALERSAEAPDFSQLIWMPRDVEVRDDRQEEFIQSVRGNTSERTELTQGILEDLKTYLISKLKALPAEPVVKSCAELLQIYLIYDRKDHNAMKRLKVFLHNQNFEVLTLAKDSRAKDHKNYLAQCDVAMIFQDQADEDWRDQKLRELRKIPIKDPSRKLLGRAVYLAGPMTEDKEMVMSHAIEVIKECGEFPPKELLQFIEQVRR